MGLKDLLKKIKAREHEIRLVFIGLEGAGKTSVIASFLKKPIDGITPTQGFVITNEQRSDYKLSLWDLSGQQSTRASWHSFFDGADVVVFVLDGTDHQNLEEFKKEFENALSKDRGNQLTWAILINKSDIPNCLSVKDLNEVLDLQQHAPRKIMPFNVSAKNKNGIDEAFNVILNDVASKMVY